MKVRLCGVNEYQIKRFVVVVGVSNNSIRSNNNKKIKDFYLKKVLITNARLTQKKDFFVLVHIYFITLSKTVNSSEGFMFIQSVAAVSFSNKAVSFQDQTRTLQRVRFIFGKCFQQEFY